MKANQLIMILTAMSGLVVGQTHAFVVDNSEQRVIMIGKGGAESMQPVSVPVPSVRISETRTVATVPSTQVAANTAYNTSSYSGSGSAYTPPAYNSYNNNYSNQFDRLVVATNSAAAVVFDVQTGQPIYEKNVNNTRSIASITKMMTAMVVLDSNQDMRDELVISSSDLVGAKQASTNLRAGDRLSRSEFMLMMLMKSENPAAKTLASHYYGGYNAFIAAMNQKAESLGMYQTRFSDASGLDPRNVSTANDLVKMMREIATNPRYQTIRNFSTAPSYSFYITNYNSGSRTYNASNTSTLVRSGSYALGASKTGYIREAGHCVVMEAHVNGRPSIIVLLGANGSQNRWRDAETILGQLAYR